MKLVLEPMDGHAAEASFGRRRESHHHVSGILSKTVHPGLILWMFYDLHEKNND